MTYLKPNLETLGSVQTVVLGTAQDQEPDNAMDGVETRPGDIVAGLDD